MKRKKQPGTRGITFPILAVLLFTGAAAAYGIDGTEIMRQVEAGQKAKTTAMRLSMHIFDSLEAAESRDLLIESYGRGESASYMEFVAPRSITGLRILDLDGDIRVFFPSTGRVRRIAGGQKSSSIGGVGGDFSYEDMGGGSLMENYSFSLVEELPDRYIIRGETRDPDSSYSHVLFTVTREPLVVRQIEYFTRARGLEKTMIAEKVQFLQGRQVATVIKMINHRERRRTELRIHQVIFDSPIDDRYFDPNRFYR